MNGAHGGGKGSVQGVVENWGADVGHDGVQQWLTQVLLLGGHRGGRGLTTEQNLFIPQKLLNTGQSKCSRSHHSHIVLQLLQSDLALLQRLQRTPVDQEHR